MKVSNTQTKKINPIKTDTELKKKTERWLKQTTQPVKALISTSIALGYFQGLCIAAQAWCIANILYPVLFQNEPIQNQSTWVLALITIICLRCILLLWGQSALVRATQRWAIQTRKTSYQNLKALGPSHAVHKGSGALVNALNDGINNGAKYIQHYIPAKSLVTFLPITIALIVMPLDWKSSAIMLITAPIIPVFMILIGDKARHKNDEQWQNLARLSNHLLDAVQGLNTLKIFGAAQREIKALQQSADLYRRDTMSVLRLAFLSSLTLEFFATLGIALVAVLIGFRLFWGQIDFLTGLFILLIVPEFYMPLRKMGAAFHARMEALSAVSDLYEASQDIPATSQENNVALTLERAPDISFDHISFEYQSEQGILKDISFTLPAGKKIALVGASGAGKTTCLSLLLGFIKPVKGQILINNRPLSDINLEHWQSQISWIPQNPTLFHGTILENIKLGNQQASDQDIKELCQTMGLHDFIMDLPDGYQTHIGERSYGISGGQARRIALARAFLRNTPLLIMDEPTASLDHETEELMQNAITHFSTGKSVITIAHRIKTLQDYDCIYFMKDGAITASGTHQDLANNHEDYQIFLKALPDHQQQKGAA